MTHIDTSRTKLISYARTRADLYVLLQWQLSDAFDLTRHTKQVHWSMHTPWFHVLHPFFDNVERDMNTYTAR
jgi:DNA-binding ferritin-like protein